ncbi:MAG: hypothetical protein WBA57_04140 [Elainellaceae cyanobacterium]
MKKILLIIALLTATTISAQTSLGFSTGVLEESNKLGLGIASTISLEQNIIGDGGVGVDYSYAFVRDNNFQQLSVVAFQEFIVDRTLSLKFSAGGARQVSGNIYPTASFDILVKASDKVKIVLGWNPTPRGQFRDPETGWSLITTMGLIYKL